MTAQTMRDAIVNKFGKDSWEAGYAQHLFADRGTEWLERYYQKVMQG